MTVSEPLRLSEPVRFTYEEFVRYTEEHPEGDFELLDGMIYHVAPEGTEPRLTRFSIQEFLHDVLDRTKYMAGSKGSFPAPGSKEGPKPDNFVARGALATYVSQRKNPTSSDMLVVIEITNERSPETDAYLVRKRNTYARVSIPDYWLIDLVNASVIVHRNPSGDTSEPTFESIQKYSRGETIEALAVEGLCVSCSFLLTLAAN